MSAERQKTAGRGHQTRHTRHLGGANKVSRDVPHICSHQFGYPKSSGIVKVFEVFSLQSTRS